MPWMQAVLQNIKTEAGFHGYTVRISYNCRSLEEFHTILCKKTCPLSYFLCIILTCTESFTGVTRRNGGTNGYFIN